MIITTRIKINFTVKIKKSIKLKLKLSESFKKPAEDPQKTVSGVCLSCKTLSEVENKYEEKSRTFINYDGIANKICKPTKTMFKQTFEQLQDLKHKSWELENMNDLCCIFQEFGIS